MDCPQKRIFLISALDPNLDLQCAQVLESKCSERTGLGHTQPSSSGPADTVRIPATGPGIANTRSGIANSGSVASMVTASTHPKLPSPVCPDLAIHSHVLNGSGPQVGIEPLVASTAATSEPPQPRGGHKPPLRPQANPRPPKPPRRPWKRARTESKLTNPNTFREKYCMRVPR